VLIVRRDDRLGLFIIEAAGPPHRRFSFDAIAAFEQKNLQPASIAPRDLAKLSGPPPAWLLSASLGVLLALSALRSRRHLGPLWASSPQWQQGIYDGRNTITLVDKDQVLSAKVTQGQVPLAEGPMVILSAKTSLPPMPYRSLISIDGALLVPGTIEELKGKLSEAVAGCYAFCLAVLSCSCSPLIAALLSGFG
jgi:hypothetical protein